MMRSRAGRFALVVLVALIWAQAALAARQKVTVKYLIAALGTLQVRDEISVEGVYVGDIGMEEALRGPLRNKGMTRFAIRDPESGAVFDLMYCEVDGPVFKTLIKINGEKHFVFEGVRVQGETRQGSILAKSIRPKRLPQTVVKTNEAKPLTTVRPTKFRVIMTEQATGNRTVTSDVEVGKEYEIMGNTILIQNMDVTTTDVEVIQ